MNKSSNYEKIVGMLTISAGILSAVCIVLGAYAVDYNFEAFSEPTLVLNYAHHSEAAYWFLLFDMAGYYLLLLPVISICINTTGINLPGCPYSHFREWPTSLWVP